MTSIEEKTQQITVSYMARRIKHELNDMKKQCIFNDDDFVTITKYHGEDFDIIFRNIKDNRLYKFIISPKYPFKAPELVLNNRPYSSYFLFKSPEFRELFYKYKGHRCFSCESLLCPNNWKPTVRLTKIIEEVNLFYKECKEIIDIVIVNVIKRKYLIDDINIIEWLF